MQLSPQPAGPSRPSPSRGLDGLARFSWVVLAVNLLVILWGAYVRASGSGAGCGSHWPLCNGVVVPRAPSTATLVELSHRLSSGVALLLVLSLLIVARRARPPGDPTRRAAAAAMGFMVAEALVGAALVLLSLVAKDASLRRAVALAVHLVNTFLLLASLTLTAYHASGGRRPVPGRRGLLAWLVLPALGAALLVSVAGAVTALGDTLFPARTLAEGLRQDLSATSHWLLRLRVIHPSLAVFSAIYLVLVSGVAAAGADRTAARLGRLCVAMMLLQMGCGALNLLLLAPVPMQLLHLLLGDLLWICLVLLYGTAAGAPGAEDAAAAPSRSQAA